MHLDKESYERAGLVGKPDGVKGARGMKPRWSEFPSLSARYPLIPRTVVELNLRLPSMLHGRKGFNRIVYAFKNVITAPVTWLFCNLAASGKISRRFHSGSMLIFWQVLTPDPLDAHFPAKRTVSPVISQGIRVNLPVLNPLSESASYGADFEDYAVEMHEWLSLALVESPRIRSDDDIDSFLSRYGPPGASTTSSTLVKITWQGFLSPSWAHNFFFQALLAAPQDTWFAYFVVGFGESLLGGSKDCTILKLPNAPNEYVLWEVA